MNISLEPPLPAALAVDSHAPALQWARGHFPAQSAELLTHSGWSTVYRVSGDGAAAYLKIVPPAQYVQVPRLQSIAQQFPEHVPPVIAADSTRGWLLAHDHGGEEPSAYGPEDRIDLVLKGFARLQARAAGLPGFLASMPAVRLPTLTDDFLAFLANAAGSAQSAQGAVAIPAEEAQHSSQAAQTVAPVGLAYFIGDAAAARYSRLFGARAKRLREQCAKAAALPQTLVHGDLHAGNTAITPGDAVRFIDWDEAAAGVAGMCLHGVFSGCTDASAALTQLQESGTVVDDPRARWLAVYVDELVAQGYATRAALLQGLGGAMCAGQMRFITSYGRYPGEEARAAAGATLVNKLSDLLDLCDWLVRRDPVAAAEALDDYARGSEWRRAARMARDQAARQPGDPDALARHAAMSWQLGETARAGDAWQELLANRGLSAQQRATALLGLARTHAARLDLLQAHASLSEALSLAPGMPDVAAVAARLQWIAQVRSVAATATGLPRVAITQREREDGRLAPDTLALLVEMFKQYGVVQVDGAFELGHIEHLRAAFRAGYSAQFHDGAHADALQVGDKRWMLTMRLDDDFGASGVVASPLLAFFQQILGTDCILSAYTAVISMPGSQDQSIHKDHSALFEERGWSFEHPCFAAQMVVPLLAMNEQTGATRVHKGSQRMAPDAAADLPFQDPVVPLGSCLLVDYAVSHYGLGNRSDQVRPILNLVYSRPWFRDSLNYHLQPPLRFGRAYFDAAPEHVRKLLAWWELERRAAFTD